MTPSAARTIRRSTPWMWRCGCLLTQPWWRPCSVAWTVTSHGQPKRRASLRAAPATSQSWEWTRSKRERVAERGARGAHVVVHGVDPAHEGVEVVLGELGSRTRCTVTPWRSSTAARCPPPRASTWTSTPSRTSPSASLRTCRARPPSTIGGYSHDRIRTRVGTPAPRTPTGSHALEQRQPVRRGELGDLGAARELAQRAGEHVAPGARRARRAASASCPARCRAPARRRAPRPRRARTRTPSAPASTGV